MINRKVMMIVSLEQTKVVVCLCYTLSWEQRFCDVLCHLRLLVIITFLNIRYVSKKCLIYQKDIFSFTINLLSFNEFIEIENFQNILEFKFPYSENFILYISGNEIV
jgi:hypothetical protein